MPFPTRPKKVETVYEGTDEQVKRYDLAKRRLEAAARYAMRRYYTDPVAWAHDCIRWPAGQSLTPYQEDVLSHLPQDGRVAQRGPHGLGKSTVSAIAILWFAITRDAAQVDWKCVTTAGGWHQLEHYLWPEIHKWVHHLNWDKIGRGPFTQREMLQLTLHLNHGEAFAVASNQPARIEGAHADSILYIFDESKAIVPAIFDAAEGAFSGATEGREAFAFASSTPGEPTGRFYDIHAHKLGFEDWWTRHVTLQEALDAKRVAPDWAEQRKKQWGEGSALYANRVLGEFHSSDEDAIIPLPWIEAAVERWYENQKKPTSRMTRLGIDVAGMGDDMTVFAPWHMDRLQPLTRFAHIDTEEIADKAQLEAVANLGVEVVVDADGMGVGVYDKLNHDRRVNVLAFHAGGKSEKKDRSGELAFLNARAAAWWQLREELDPMQGSTIELPDDDLLIGDLCAPKWLDKDSKGVIKVEPKDDVRERLGRSPDSGDAAVMGRYKERMRRHARMTFAGAA